MAGSFGPRSARKFSLLSLGCCAVWIVAALIALDLPRASPSVGESLLFIQGGSQAAALRAHIRGGGQRRVRGGGSSPGAGSSDEQPSSSTEKPSEKFMKDPLVVNLTLLSLGALVISLALGAAENAGIINLEPAEAD
eukprot:TRINITY_DN66797_c0_g2_i1.p1 TRINITY_DN66797_c0_g2~~TRINITY_DN66797_c0_g2_i1.p1  ORF type:complete len:137 (+),score=14.63 TRINITY_DN66797_c0_g2_i1:102-512(+)